MIRGAAAGWLLLLSMWSIGAAAEPRVMISVDTESNEMLSLPRQVDATCAGGVPCGLMRMVSVLEQRGMAGTFFLDVYEYKAWGEPALRSLAQQLQARGHDVALHTHPQWAYDPHRPYMYQYTLDEQTNIIADGMRLLQGWTGLPVVAHRAGAYSANADSLQALNRNGIVLDASYFPGHPLCRLDGLGLPANFPATIDHMVEIPVSVYERLERPGGPGKWLPAHTSIGKIDVNAVDDPTQAVAAFDAVTASGVPVVVIFLHSFSFIAAPGHDGGPPVANELAMRVFDALIAEAASKHVRSVTSRELAARGNDLVSESAPQRAAHPGVPRVNITVPAVKYAVRVLRPHLVASAIVAAALLFAAAALWSIRRRTRTVASVSAGS